MIILRVLCFTCLGVGEGDECSHEIIVHIDHCSWPPWGKRANCHFTRTCARKYQFVNNIQALSCEIFISWKYTDWQYYYIYTHIIFQSHESMPRSPIIFLRSNRVLEQTKINQIQATMSGETTYPSSR